MKINDVKNDGSLRVIGKGRKERILPMTDQAYKIISLWLKSNRAEFLKNTNKNLFENEDFVDYLFSLELAKSTINRKLTSVNNFLLWTSKLDKYKGKTFRKSENLKTEKKLPNILTSNYINNLID